MGGKKKRKRDQCIPNYISMPVSTSHLPDVGTWEDCDSCNRSSFFKISYVIIQVKMIYSSFLITLQWHVSLNRKPCSAFVQDFLVEKWKKLITRRDVSLTKYVLKEYNQFRGFISSRIPPNPASCATIGYSIILYH